MDTDEPERVLKAPTVYTPPVPKQVAPAAPCTLQARARARAYRVPNQRVRALSQRDSGLLSQSRRKIRMGPTSKYT